MRIAFALLVTAALAGPAFAQQPGVAVPGAAQATAGPDDVRVNQLIVYGDDPCPQSTGDEIIVCARLPEDDRFRIPPDLRENPNDPASNSWANRALELSYAGRTGTESCSTVGGGGFTGCFNQIVQQARAERRGGGEWSRMIEEARDARARQINEAEAEDTEAERDEPE